MNITLTTTTSNVPLKFNSYYGIYESDRLTHEEKKAVLTSFLQFKKLDLEPCGIHFSDLAMKMEIE